MTDLERLFRYLVRTLATTTPGRLRQPIAVADIRGTIIPYRHHRRALGIDSSEDYEMALIRLCAGEGGLALSSPEEARVRFEAEAASVNPELGVVRQFGDALITLTPIRVAEIMQEAPEPPAPEAGAAMDTDANTVTGDDVSGSGGGSGDMAADAVPDGSGETLVDALFTPSPTHDFVAPPEGVSGAAEEVVPPSTVSCVTCGEILPLDRPVKFCPYCGKSQTPRQCSACGAALEAGWRFCTFCGQGA